MILISQVTPVTKSTRRFYLGAQILAQKGIPSGSLVLISSLPATHNEKPLNVTKKASRSHPDVSTITKVATYIHILKVKLDDKWVNANETVTFPEHLLRVGHPPTHVMCITCTTGTVTVTPPDE